MKLNSTQIRGATLLALLAGLSPALIAQTAADQSAATRDQQTIPGDTDRDARARERTDGQRPGHNSNRTPGQQVQSSSNVTQDPSTDRDTLARDRTDTQRPGHNSDRMAGQHAQSSTTTNSTAGTSTVNRDSKVRLGTDRDGRLQDGLGQTSDGQPATGTDNLAASGIVYTDDHVGRQDETSQTRSRSERDLSRSELLRKGSANEMTGMAVTNRSGENLGRIKDFVIDTQSGQVVYAVVGSGGVAGIGEKLHAVPVQALSHSTAGDRESMTLDVEASRWAQAPRFSKDRLTSLQQDQQGRSIHEYYGQTWRAGPSVSMNNPVRNQGSQAGTTAGRQETRSLDTQSQGGRLALASNLIGKNIRSGSQSVGEIEDVIVQLESGSAAALLDPDNDFAGSDQKYIVPLNRLTLSENNMLTANLQRSDFSSARTVSGGSWATGQSDSLIVWQDSRQSGRGDSAHVTSPQIGRQQGTPPVAEIRRAIQSDASLASNQSDIQVEAQGDKLVLRGTVLNKDAKDKIEDRAEKAAPGWDIDNQLSVANTGDMEE